MTAAKSGTKRTSDAPVDSATNDLPTAVLVVVVCDLFHAGHVRLLERARRCGDRLVVAINGDDLVREYKRQPIFNEHSRSEIVDACRHVDSAFIAHSYDIKPLIAQFGIDVIVYGDERERQSYLRQIRVTEEFLAASHVRLAFLPYTIDVSTAAILQIISSTNDQSLRHLASRSAKRRHVEPQQQTGVAKWRT